MKFIEVKELPKRKVRTDLRQKLDEFMAMNIKIAKVEMENRYSSIRVAQGTIHTSAKHGGYPITVRTIDGEIYLIRKDI